jgi:hypothetical protein
MGMAPAKKAGLTVVFSSALWRAEHRPRFLLIMQSPIQGLSRWLTRPVFRISAIALLLLTPGIGGWVSHSWAQSEPEGVEVLTRGPVHEAFAATINFKPTEGLIVAKVPPEAIQEVPPEQRPEGDNVTWIPGYWGWDDETDGFLWVSGIWRNLPPGRQWIPGYWWDSAQGYQWISGYWADAETDEVEYLSEPPASLEAGPNVAAPSKSHSWIPGTWRWNESRYAWQPGYWYEVQPDWVWVPPYYTWAPQGWLFVDGYYDYDVPHRGLVFAPVRFSSSYYSRPDYFYRPTTVISLSVFTNHLFLRPRSRHYYFGDYYAPQYRQSGFFASFNYFSGGHGYDPIYSHERWRHRDDDRWERRRRDDFDYYRDNKSARPPRTFAALRDYRSRSDRDDRRGDSDYATRLDQLAERSDSPVRLRKVAEAEQKTFSQRGQEIRDFGDQRRKLSGRDADRNSPRRRSNDGDTKSKPEEGKPVKAKLPKSPVMARAGEGTSRPPRRPGSSTGRETAGDTNDGTARREPSENRADNNDRRPPKGERTTESPADRDAPRRGTRVQEPKKTPKVDRKDPPTQNKPKREPRNPAREDSRPDQQQPGNRESNPNRESRPKVREEAVQPRRESESESSAKKETRGKKAPSPQAGPGRAVPAPVPAAKPKAEPKRARPPEPQSNPQREARKDPKRTQKSTPRTEPKREPQADPRRESPPPSQKESKASPRPSPKTPAPAPQKPKKGEPKPESDKEKKKKTKEKTSN